MAKLNSALIRTDGGTQVRSKLDDNKVFEYSQQMSDGDVFPPVTVFHDGSDYWLASGFHRFFANKRIGRVSIEVDLRQGTKRDAVLYALTSNRNHGMPLSSDEIRNCVMRMLEDEEWQKWSNAEIARHVGCSSMTVGRIKEKINSEKVDEKKYINKHGQEAVIKTGKIGVSKPKEEKPKEEKKNIEAETESKDDENITRLVGIIDSLEDENKKLRDQIAVGQWDATEIEKIDIQDTLNDLRSQIKTLEAENAALRDSRDMFQSRNAELMKSVKSLQAKLNKGT